MAHNDKENNVDRLIERAMALRDSGKHRDAIATFSDLILLRPLCEFYNERGALYWKCGEYDKAIVDLTDAIGLNNSDPDCYINRGNAYLSSSAFEAAIDDYTCALDLSPNNTFALNNRAQAFAECGNLDAALADFKTAIQLDDEYASPLFNLGVVLLRNQDLEGALGYLNRAAELQPHEAKTLCIRGELFETKGEDRSALQDYESAVMHNPECVFALRRLSWFLSTTSDDSLRDATKALSHAKTCCELTAYDAPDCLDALARAYSELGDFDAANRWETRAFRLRDSGQ